MFESLDIFQIINKQKTMMMMIDRQMKCGVVSQDFLFSFDRPITIQALVVSFFLRFVILFFEFINQHEIVFLFNKINQLNYVSFDKTTIHRLPMDSYLLSSGLYTRQSTLFF